MLSAIVTALLSPIMLIFSALLSPVINGAMALFPDIATHFNNFLGFLDIASTYFHCCLRWLLFTPNMFNLLFVYFLFKFYAFTLMATTRFVVKIYNYLKP